MVSKVTIPEEPETSDFFGSWPRDSNPQELILNEWDMTSTENLRVARIPAWCRLINVPSCSECHPWVYFDYFHGWSKIGTLYLEPHPDRIRFFLSIFAKRFDA